MIHLKFWWPMTPVIYNRQAKLTLFKNNINNHYSKSSFIIDYSTCWPQQKYANFIMMEWKVSVPNDPTYFPSHIRSHLLAWKENWKNVPKRVSADDFPYSMLVEERMWEIFIEFLFYLISLSTALERILSSYVVSPLQRPELNYIKQT